MRIFHIFFYLVVFIFLSCEIDSKMNSITGYALGTSYQINYQELNINKEEIRRDIDSLFNVINSSISTYKSDSDINKINFSNVNVIVDNHFVRIFKKVSEIWKETNGYFDPTIGSLVNAYGFGPKKGLNNISIHQKDSIQKLIGWDKITLTKENKILKKNNNIIIDFNAIGKGYMVDLIDQYLINLGSNNHLVEIGGEIIGRGKNLKSNKYWNVAIEKPSNKNHRSIISIVEIKNNAIATSGNYRKYRIDSLSGKKYVHIINPKTGDSIKSNILSATVITSDCMSADAYATALMVMTLEEGINFVEENKEIEAYWIIFESDRFKEVYSKGWGEKIN